MANTETTKNTFVMYRSICSVAKKLSNEEAGILFKAISDYALDGIKTDLPTHLEIIMELSYPSIDSASKRYENSVNNGKKGGRPKTQKNPEITQSKPNNNPVITENKPGANLNVDVDVDDNKDENKDENKDVDENKDENKDDNMSVQERVKKRIRQYVIDNKINPELVKDNINLAYEDEYFKNFDDDEDDLFEYVKIVGFFNIVEHD